MILELIFLYFWTNIIMCICFSIADDMEFDEVLLFLPFGFVILFCGLVMRLVKMLK